MQKNISYSWNKCLYFIIQQNEWFFVTNWGLYNKPFQAANVKTTSCYDLTTKV